MKIDKRDLNILPYTFGSNTAKVISNIFYESDYNNLAKPIQLNIGSSVKFNKWAKLYINHPLNVAKAINKVECLKLLSKAGVPVPEFTTEYSTAKFWEAPVFCRTNITGARGDGIVVADSPQDIIPDCELYTKGIKVLTELRVICDKNGRNVIALRKLKTTDGFKYLMLSPTEELINLGVKSVRALGLDFAAIDILVDGNFNNYVLEVNTAFGVSKLQDVHIARLFEGVLANVTYIDYIKTLYKNFIYSRKTNSKAPRRDLN